MLHIGFPPAVQAVPGKVAALRTQLAHQLERLPFEQCHRLLAVELKNLIMLPGVRERLSADLTNGLALLGNDADPDSSERTL